MKNLYYWVWDAAEAVAQRTWHIGYSDIFIYGCNDEHPKRIGIFD